MNELIESTMPVSKQYQEEIQEDPCPYGRPCLLHLDGGKGDDSDLHILEDMVDYIFHIDRVYQ